MATISVVLTAFNEEKMLPACLDSVKKIADEIIIINSSSTDNTEQIAKKYTKKVFTQKNDPLNIDVQKNLGFSKATSDWILSLDADERLTPELIEEIKRAVMDNEKNGFWIPRKNIILGKWMQHTGWYPDEQLRLFRKGKGKYTAKHVHEDLTIEGELGNLTNPLIHENYQRISQFIERNFLRYAPNEAENILKNGYSFSYLDAIRFPVREFLSRFFAREGYKDGLHGLVLSLLLAAYHLVIFCYIWEKKDFIEEKPVFDLKHIHHESGKLGEEFQYWFTNEQIKNESNPLKKVLLKTKRKFA